MDIQAFVQHQERDRKPFLVNDPEVDGLVSRCRNLEGRILTACFKVLSSISLRNMKKISVSMASGADTIYTGYLPNISYMN
jgi:hypothetical protein